MRRRCIAALIAMGTTISVPALAADEARAKFMQAAALPARSVIDNERVTVWDTTGSLPAAAHDFVAISLSQPGNAVFGHAGDTVGMAGARAIVIELRDHQVAPIPNNSGYPNAYPRPHIEKILENDRVIVWRYRWNLGEPTPMHFHDKDVVVVYLEDSALQSTEPNGKSILNEYKSGDIRFNRRNRTHTELLVRDAGSAIITELK
ncbi:hypothetical protein [Bradyrhizobium sp.]|uniref:hypothetical protein n=1 Tax=Bradyrhizobium sp. TaxID=376 RepID=UPI003C784240